MSSTRPILRSFAAALLISATLSVSAEAQTGSVSGTIVDSNAAAIAGALVRVDDGSGGFSFGTIDFTDMTGAFLIDDLAPGTYELTARRFGYETTTAMIDIVDGQTTDAGAIVLLEPTFGDLAGIVTDSGTAAPIEGARVRAFGGTGGFFGGFGGGSGQDLTDATGAYSITDVRTGDRTLRVSAPGYFTSTVDVTVADGVVTTTDVALDPLAFGSVAGIVTDAATSAPIEGAFVVVRSGFSGGFGGGFGSFFGAFAVAQTDATGAYSLSDVLVGDRDVRVWASGYFSQTQTVTVTDGGTATADFAMGGLTYGSVSGIVTDVKTGAPIEGAWVRVQTGGGWVQTDATGAYTVTDVLTGTRSVRVFAQGYFFATMQADILDGQTTTADFALDPR